MGDLKILDEWDPIGTSIGPLVRWWICIGRLYGCMPPDTIEAGVRVIDYSYSSS